MKVLLSIKPEFAFRIFAGTKKYEFRRSIFKRRDIRKAVVYASSPIKKVIGEFIIEDVLCDDIETIWRETELSSGIERAYYMEYFRNKERAYAIKIRGAVLYKEARDLSYYHIDFVPQSFAYVE